MAPLSIYDRGWVKRRSVERRGTKWLRQTPWPFDLLLPEARPPGIDA